MTPYRKEIEAYVYQHLNTIDPSGYNEKYYRSFFGSMSDEMFDAWMEALTDPHTPVVLKLFCPAVTVVLDMENLKADAHSIGLTLFEPVKIWDSVSKRYYTTPEEHLVVTLPVRRFAQTLDHKMSVPASDKTINPLTGQVTKPDKGSAISMTEALTLDAKGLTKSLSELLTVRGGDISAYAQFKSELEETGSVTVSDLTSTEGVRSRTTARAYLNSMHLSNTL